MKRLIQTIVLSTATLFFFSSAVSASVDLAKLQSFWSSHTNLTSSPTADFISGLKNAGVEDINDLAPYLDSELLRSDAVYSMFALAPESKPLDGDAMTAIIYLVKYSPRDSFDRLTGIRLLMNYPDKDVVEKLGVLFSPQENYCALEALGELARRDKSKEEIAEKYAKRNLIEAGMYFPGGAIPPGQDNASIFLTAIKLPLYERPELAKLAAKFLFNRIEKPFRRFSSPEFETAVNFLLHDSKPDPDFLVQQFTELACSEDANLASVTIWLLNEWKDTPIAKKAIDAFSAKCDRNKNILQTIQSGTAGKKEAFDEPMKLLYQKTSTLPTSKN